MKKQTTYRLISSVLALLVLVLAVGSPMLLSDCRCKASAALATTSCTKHTKATTKSCCSAPPKASAKVNLSKTTTQLTDNCCCVGKVQFKATKTVLQTAEELPIVNQGAFDIDLLSSGAIKVAANSYQLYNFFELVPTAHRYYSPPLFQRSAAVFIWVQSFLL